MPAGCVYLLASRIANRRRNATRGQRFAEWQAKYPTIQQRTLLLWGREDQVTLPSFGERLAKDLPHAKLVFYPLCGHFPMIEQASASTADLVQFIDAGPK